ncbi:hypothetical protein [Amantichitinum ursilacus]|uniref:Uncharacterized protein n=1 Tax=Amantichitinum ursilacus TaxID=857265 RepID=A0A0N0XHE0_9NEIS|nr:hypothetical protein [Amantichitinum ursilacus]KPC50713.1 hypothetical protein WG78_16705 [Amantichitinum ursilacus]
MKKTKKQELHRLMEVYGKVVNSLASLDHPTPKLIIDTWPSTRQKFFEMLESKATGMTPSVLVGGLKQGLLEMPQVFGGMPVDLEKKAVESYLSVINEELPEFFAQMDADLQVILGRGRIRSEKEFYLVRLMLDQAEKDGQTVIIEQLMGLISPYESR